MTHTPGPWRVAPDDTSFGGYVAISGGDHFGLAEVVVELGGKPYPDGEANAKLIAAAPEMLEALRALVDDVESKWGDPHTLRHARATLAKAEGRP